MAQTYTLEEAADKLNLSIEEFKRRMQTEWTRVRPFRDGATVRYRANEIEELARSIGLGSSEELPLADSSELDVPGEIGLTRDKAKTPAPAKRSAPKDDDDAPLKLDDSDDIFMLAPEEPPAPKSSRNLKSKSDSDVRLEKATKKPYRASDDEESILTDEFDLPSAGGSGKLSGKSGKLSSAKLKSGDSGKHKPVPKPVADDSSSEFELSLEPDSDEFELSVTPDSSEEVSLGDMPAESKNKAGQSGINLNRPADSGVSLEKKRKKTPVPADDDEIDFELSLDAPGTGISSKKKHGSGKKSGKKMEADSDSEFELTLEEPSDFALDAGSSGKGKKGDIFEATDFEIPALEDDSASEAVSLDEADTDLESSDFDLAIDDDDAAAEDDESKSEVVALDDEDVDALRARKKKKKKRPVASDDDDDGIALGDEDDEDDSVGAALTGVSGDDDDDEYEVSQAADDGPMAYAPPPKWGVLPALLMAPTVLIMFIGGIMAYEMLHSVWGAQQATKPTTPLVSWFADTAGINK